MWRDQGAFLKGLGYLLFVCHLRMWQEREITGTGRELQGCHFPKGVSVLPATTLSQTPEVCQQIPGTVLQ